ENGRRFESDLVVHGAGRSADIDGLELDRAGVEASRQGIVVDERMQTTNPEIYAVGDCAATVQLARVADAEAHAAAADIVGIVQGTGRASRMDYTAVPAVLFTYPQYAMVGATEQELVEAGVAFEKSERDHLDWPTYRRVGMHSAAYKVMVAKDGGLILGAHILSDSATGLINTFTMAMRNGIPVAELHRQGVMTP
ncbi:MAG TPA: FAD-dependent oxidoreductase, partial [Desulfosarcina sp.]|nr:FAD-dependent oxidoreductase [Desulfosarcina sp.]